jgi:hypothetical protein
MGTVLLIRIYSSHAQQDTTGRFGGSEVTVDSIIVVQDQYHRDSLPEQYYSVQRVFRNGTDSTYLYIYKRGVRHYTDRINITHLLTPLKSDR